MAAKRKSARAKPRRKYKRRGKPKEVPGNIDKPEVETPLTLTQRAHAAEEERDMLRNEMNGLVSNYQREREEVRKSHQKEVTGLQNEVGMLRAMHSRMIFGGVHVRKVDNIGPGCV